VVELLRCAENDARLARSVPALTDKDGARTALGHATRPGEEAALMATLACARTVVKARAAASRCVECLHESSKGSDQALRAVREVFAAARLALTPAGGRQDTGAVDISGSKELAASSPIHPDPPALASGARQGAAVSRTQRTASKGLQTDIVSPESQASDRMVSLVQELVLEEQNDRKAAASQREEVHCRLLATIEKLTSQEALLTLQGQHSRPLSLQMLSTRSTVADPWDLEETELARQLQQTHPVTHCHHVHRPQR
jgi:hypothetical protein